MPRRDRNKMSANAIRKAVVRLTTRTVIALCVLSVIGGLQHAFGQNPFGVGKSGSSAPAIGGFAGWLLAKQAAYYREFAGLIRAAKADGSAGYSLMGLSFVYGIFHAAGPGHGKAVISSYLIASGETWRRGITLSLASALLQAGVAIAIVGLGAALVGGTAKLMGDSVRGIEIASYLLIVLVGVRLLLVKGRAFYSEMRAAFPRPQNVKLSDHIHSECNHHDFRCDTAAVDVPVRQACGTHCAHHHRHDHHPHDHHHNEGEHSEDTCGHSHGPQPQELAGAGGWQRGLSAIVAVGLRPCSGAILVLVFALAQELFWAGAASALVMGLGTALTVAAIATLAVAARSVAVRLAGRRPGLSQLALRGLETAAAIVVVVFGSLLLLGYMASERLMFL